MLPDACPAFAFAPQAFTSLVTLSIPIHFDEDQKLFREMGAFPTKDQIKLTCFELHTELGREVFVFIALCKDNFPSAQCNLFQKFYRLRCEPHVRHWVNANVARDQLKAPPPKDEVYMWHIQHASLALDRAVSGDGGPVPLPILILKLEPATLERCLQRFCDDDPLKCHFSWNGIRLNLSDLEDYPEESTAVAKVGFRAFNEKGIGGTKGVESGFYARDYWTTGYATAFLQRACQLCLNGEQGLNSVPTQFESSTLVTDAWLLLFFWKLFALLGTTITTDLKLKLNPPDRNPEKVTFLLGGNPPSSTALDAAKKLRSSSFPQSYHRDVMSVEAVELTNLAVDRNQQSDVLKRHFQLLVESMKQWEVSNAILAQYETAIPKQQIFSLEFNANGSANYKSLFPVVASIHDEIRSYRRSMEALESTLSVFKLIVKGILHEAPSVPFAVEEELGSVSRALQKGTNELHGRLEAASQRAEMVKNQTLAHADVDAAVDDLRTTLQRSTKELRSLKLSCEGIQWIWKEFSSVVDFFFICRASRVSLEDPTRAHIHRLVYEMVCQGRWHAFFSALNLRRHRTHCLESIHLATSTNEFSRFTIQGEVMNLQDQRASLRQRLTQLQELDKWLAEYMSAAVNRIPGVVEPDPRVPGTQDSAQPLNLSGFQGCFPPTVIWDRDEGDFDVIEELKGKAVRQCKDASGASGWHLVLKTFRDPLELRKELQIMKQINHPPEGQNVSSGISSFHYAFELGYNESARHPPPATSDPSRPLPHTPSLLFDKFSYILVMPYYPCKSTDWFSARVQRGEWVAFVQGLIDVAKAVQELHGLGFIHGDLKPEHILFDPNDGTSAKPKLVGFGAAAPVAAHALHSDVVALGECFASWMAKGNNEVEVLIRAGLGINEFQSLGTLVDSMVTRNSIAPPPSCDRISQVLQGIVAGVGH